MSLLSKTHQQRWEAAIKLFESLIDCAYSYDADILFGGEIISPSQIDISPTMIRIVDGNASYIMFEADPSCAHGLELSSKEYAEQIKQQIKLVKQVRW